MLMKKIVIKSLLCGLILLLGFTTSTFSQEKIIQVWHTESAKETMDVMGEIIADFEKLHPGVKVKQLGAGFFEMLPKIQSAIRSGNPPEVAQWLTTGLIERGLLRPLDDVMNTIKGDLLYPDILNKIGYRNGHWYGIPHAVGTSMLVYRKDWVREKGLKLPETWDEWLEFTGKFVQDLNKDGVPDIWGYIARGDPGSISFEFALWVASNDGHLYDKETGNPTFTHERVIETLDFYKKRNKYLSPAWLNTNYMECMVQLAQGKVAQFMGYGRGISFFEKYSDPKIANPDHFGVMRRPRGPHGKDGIANQDGEPWIILKGSKYPELAAEFLKFFFKRENYQKYCLAFPIHLLPITRAVSENPGYLNNPVIKKWKEWLLLQQEQQRLGITRFGPQGLSQWYEMDFPWVMDITLSGIVAGAVTDVLVENKTSREAAATAQRKAEEFIRTGGYREHRAPKR